MVASVPQTESSAKALLDAANSASEKVALLHVTFLALCAYVLVIVFSTTDTDLLIGKGIKLPIVDVEIPIVGFYAAVPYLIVLVHFNLLLQLQLLSAKLYAFDEAAAKDHEAGRLHDQINIFPYNHYLVGRPSQLVRRLVALVVTITMLLLPLATLLVLQARFLAYQSELVTWAQRAATWLDIVVVTTLWPVIMDRLFAPVLRRGLRWLSHGRYFSGSQTKPLILGAAGLLTTMVLGLALPLILVADGERIDRPTSFGTQILYSLRHLDLREKILLTKPVQPEVIADVFSVDAARTETALRSIERLDLRNRSLRGINFDRAVIPKADLRSADLQRANMQWIQLLDADVTHAKFQGANLEQAQLASALAMFAEFQGANLRFADLEGAYLSFAKFEGSYLRYANLQGARLDHVRFQGTDLRGAKLQGATLRNAHLQGANLQDVDLQHASLRGATLYIKVMNGAKVDLVDTRDLAWQPLTRDEHAWLFWKQSH